MSSNLVWGSTLIVVGSSIILHELYGISIIWNAKRL